MSRPDLRTALETVIYCARIGLHGRDTEGSTDAAIAEQILAKFDVRFREEQPA